MQVLRFEQLVQSSPQIEEICKCSICLEIFIDPVCCENCENHFCSSCLTTWSQNIPPRSCPICNKLKEKPGQRILKNMLHELQLYCCYKPNGCEAIQKYQDYFAHVKICQFQMTKCSQPQCQMEMLLMHKQAHEDTCLFKILQCKWCNQPQLRRDLAVHENELCEHRQLICDLCYASIAVNLSADHLLNCPENVISCYWCQLEMRKKEQEEHNKTHCLKIPIQCKWCQEVFQRVEHLEHIQTCSLMELECQNCGVRMQKKFMNDHTISKCFSELRGIISNQQNQIFSQQNQIQTLVDVCSKLTQQVDVLTNKSKQAKFNISLKHSEIEVLDNCKQAFIPAYLVLVADRLIYLKNPTNQPIILEFSTITDKFVAVGFADYSNLIIRKDYYKNHHNAYLFSANGVCFISHSAEENGKKKRNFGFAANQKLELYFSNNVISVQNLMTLQQVVVQIPQQIEKLDYHPVVCLRGPKDCVQIIN